MSTSATRSGLRVAAVFHLADVTGPARSLKPRLEALTANGRGSLEVIAPGRGSLERAYRGLGELRALPYEPLTVPKGPAAALAALRRLGREVRTFRRELRRARPDLVVVVTAVLPAALIAARLEGIPTVLYVGEIFSKGHVGGKLRALGGQAVARLSETLADRLVCCSQTVASQFDGTGKATTIYPGVSLAYAGGDGDGFRRRHGLEGARPLLAVVGNVCEARGQDTAVHALAALRGRLPHAHLVIAGAPHPRPVDRAFADGVRELVERLGLARHVTFAGFVERAADLYAAADVVINPARFNEPFGRVAVEALVAGRPVVAAAVGAVPEVLDDGRDALLVPRDDPEALAEAVVRVYEDGALAERLVARGRRRVLERFDEGRGVEAFTRVVEEVLGEPRQSAPALAGATAGA